VSFLDDLVGIHYRHPDHYEVGREKIREYAVAVKNEKYSMKGMLACHRDNISSKPGLCSISG